MKVFDLLDAEKANLDYRDKLMLYGQLVGAWEIKSTWFTPDGKTTHDEGQWHFGWILGGRGVQDVLFANSFTPDRYGTTIRCYDSKHDLWRVTWMQPAHNEFVNLIGRKVGNNIVQEIIGGEDKKQIWRFTDITANSFIWRAEMSTDGGQSWILEQEMLAKRIC